MYMMVAHAINNLKCTTRGVTLKCLFYRRRISVPLDMLCPKTEVVKKYLQDMVRKLQEDYHNVQEIVKERHANN